MSTPDQHARLEMNGRAFKYDPILDPIADAIDRGDTEAWGRVHPVLADRASIYRDFREQYRRAVNAGAIPDDRNANTTRRTSDDQDPDPHPRRVAHPG